MDPGPDEDRGKPVPPREPEPGQCCQSGCARCVFDVYWEAYERYETALKAWNDRDQSAS